MLFSSINVIKDVDCFGKSSVYEIYSGNNNNLPCTVQGVLDILDYYKINIYGIKRESHYVALFLFQLQVAPYQVSVFFQVHHYTLLAFLIHLHQKDLNIPIIYDVDIGHVPPSITLISGAMAEVHFEKNQKKCYLKHLIK